MKRSSPVILASASPRRSALLKEWGVRFKTVPSNADEETSLKRPSAVVRALALRKAASVASRIPGGIVIGADTIVVLGSDIIGKPKDEKDAARILGRLNGTCHKVYSGVAVVDAATGKSRVACEVSRVRMRKLFSEEVKRLSAKHLDKAGAYAVQETGDAFVEKIEGDYFNVVGLPYGKLKTLLAPLGIKLKPFKK